ncbi:hypothetical protein A4G19_08435 [Pasteurellaceae bacterium Macca]|nr:hypothetical protein [Pasteurellaceae bacterium Macca]
MTEVIVHIHMPKDEPQTLEIDEFARRRGSTPRAVKEAIRKGEIPIMPKKGREKPIINNALYWVICLSQRY